MKKIFVILAAVILMAVSTDALAAKKVRVPLKHTENTATEYVVFASGLATNMNIAREIAQNECYGQLARNLDARVKSALEDYNSNYQVNSKRKVRIDDEAIHEGITTTLTNTKVSGIEVIETVYLTKRVSGRKTIECWVAMSMPKEFADETVQKTSQKIKHNIDDATKAAIYNDKVQFKESVENDLKNY